MPKLSDLKVVIGLSKSGLRKLNQDLRTTRGKFRKNFGEIASMAKNAALAISGTLVAGMAALIKKGAEMETLRTGFISIAGGANKAAAIVKELNDFTAKTPFQLQQVSSAARQLLAVGTQRNELQKQLQMLGDIAASSGNSIEEIASIFAKVKAKGKVELENLNQLAERGIPIFDQLRAVTGDANMEFGAGAVSVEQFNQALANMTAEGGLAAGAMENLSETVEGRMSTLMDNLGIEMAKAAERTGLTSKFGKLLEGATESLQGLGGVAQSDVAAALGVAEEAMEGFGSVTTNNLEEVEQRMADASRAVAELIAAGSQGPGAGDIALGVGLQAMGLGAFAPGLEQVKEQAAALQPLLEVQKMLAQATGQLNEQVLSGTVAVGEATIAATESTAANDKLKKGKQELIAVERSHIVELGKLKELQTTMASDILAAVDSNKTLKGSLYDLKETVSTVHNAVAVAIGDGLPSFFNSAFEAIQSGAQSFRDFMMQTLSRLLKKALALAATFAVLAALTGGATGVAQLTGGKAGFGAFMKSGFGIPQMAEGGLFTGASLAMVGEGPGTSSINPEVVAPLDKLQQIMGGGAVTVTGRLDGRDILISSERAGFDRNRVRGF